jgi:DNA replication protein DnaC
MLIHPTLDNLKALKLFGMVKGFEAQMETPDVSSLPFEDRLGLLVDQEMITRDNQRLAARLRHAKLRQQAFFEDLDLKAGRGLDRSLVLQLANSEWLRLHRNILITGKTGVGKSYLSCALAQKACRNGYTAVYHRITRLFEELAVAKAAGTYARTLQALSKKDLLILDEFALVPLTAEQRKDLLEVLEDRYDRRSTIIVSQLCVDDWYQSIGDPTFADAILDRIVHNAYKICLTGGSKRKNEVKEDQ